MRFSLKIFISFFIATLVIGSTLIWIGYQHVHRQTEEEFISRYKVFSKVMGNTLTRLDKNTESLMLNAVKVLAANDAAHGLASEEELKKLRSELSVTHIFVLDKNGNFIRSTNEDPKLIPNAFSFCPAYKEMTHGMDNLAATPIIHPNPEPKPYKFLFIPNKTRDRLLEVGVRVDFVAKTLSEALGSDENILSMSLYSPVGMPFGRFTAKDVDFKGLSTELPSEFPKVLDAKNSFHFFTKVESSHLQCCQCDVSKTSKNGEYYYVLDAEVSKKELVAMLATTKNIFIGLAIGNFLLALFIGRFLSRRLVRNIEVAVDKIRLVKKSGDLKSRLNISGKDEIAFLTKEFDRLLESLEDSQKQVIEAEKLQAKVQLAKEVAHNIQSPVIALEMMLPKLITVPEKIQKVLRDSSREIKALAERLSRQADTLSGTKKLEAVNLPVFVNDVVQLKKAEYSSSPNVMIEYQATGEKNTFSTIDPTEFSSVLSNLINNAVESYPDKSGLVQIICESTASATQIQIVDKGKGIPNEVISQLGTKSMSVGKDGHGIGLLHAYKVIKAWGGNIEIKSIQNIGTTVQIVM